MCCDCQSADATFAICRSAAFFVNASIASQVSVEFISICVQQS